MFLNFEYLYELQFNDPSLPGYRKGCIKNFTVQCRKVTYEFFSVYCFIFLKRKKSVFNNDSEANEKGNMLL